MSNSYSQGLSKSLALQFRAKPYECTGEIPIFEVPSGKVSQRLNINSGPSKFLVYPLKGLNGSFTSGRPKAHQVPERHINCTSTDFPGKVHQGLKRHINPT